MRRRRRQRALAVLGVLVGLALLGGGLFIRYRQPRVAVTPTTSPSPLFDPGLFPAPSNPVVPPDGMRIRIVDLGIDLPVIAGNGQDAPFYKAATYPGLGLPGSGHRSVIYAHARPGMFEPLFRARVGQRIEVDRADGAALRYVVREYYPSWSATDLRWLQPLAEDQLVLVTCTTYNPNDPRIIAVAVPV